MDRLYRRGYRAICSYNTKAITRKNWRNRVLAWRTGKAGCDRLRHASGKVECELSTGGIFSSASHRCRGLVTAAVEKTL